MNNKCRCVIFLSHLVMISLGIINRDKKRTRKLVILKISIYFCSVMNRQQNTWWWNFLS